MVKDDVDAAQDFIVTKAFEYGFYTDHLVENQIGENIISQYDDQGRAHDCIGARSAHLHRAAFDVVATVGAHGANDKGEDHSFGQRVVGVERREFKSVADECVGVGDELLLQLTIHNTLKILLMRVVTLLFIIYYL